MDKESNGSAAWQGRRIKNKILRVVLRVVLFALFWQLCYYLPTVAVTVINAPYKAQALSAVPAEHRDNVFLENRGMGCSRYLKGDVRLYVFFVSDGASKWTSADIEAAKNEYSSELALLEGEAERYGISLDVTCEYYEADSDDALLGSGADKWYKDVLRAAGFKDYGELKKRAQGGEYAVVFAFNSYNRSFATASSTASRDEYAVIYNVKQCLAHELCHLFGARDFYYPAEVRGDAEELLGHSLMIDSTDGTVDALTAYLVGFTEKIAEAEKFLLATDKYSRGEMDKLREYEMYTGYVEDHVYDGYVYTGHLINGMYNGNGRLVMENGDVYEGQWSYSVKQGLGIYYWAEDSSVYSGEWNGGRMEGKGTMSRPEYVYTGDFKNNRRDGYGVCYYDDGSVYSGYWLEGVRHGEGRLTLSDGTVYDGVWNMGEQVR